MSVPSFEGFLLACVQIYARQFRIHNAFRPTTEHDSQETPLLYARPNLRVVDGLLHRPPTERRTTYDIPSHPRYSSPVTVLPLARSDEDSNLEDLPSSSYLPRFLLWSRSLRADIYSARIWLYYTGRSVSSLNIHWCLSKKGVLRERTLCGSEFYRICSHYPPSPSSFPKP